MSGTSRPRLGDHAGSLEHDSSTAPAAGETDGRRSTISQPAAPAPAEMGLTKRVAVPIPDRIAERSSSARHSLRWSSSVPTCASLHPDADTTPWIGTYRSPLTPSGTPARSVDNRHRRAATPAGTLPIMIIGFDADDTLWHNEDGFQASHREFETPAQ